MNDNTIIRIRVPKHLYESVKKELTLKEGKNDFGMPGAKTVKVKDSSSGSKPKKTSAPKKANTPVKVTPNNAVKADKETGKMGAGISEKKTPKDGHKKMGLEELKALAEMLKGHIAEMEKVEEGAEDKEKVDELHFQSFIKTPGQKKPEEKKDGEKEKVQEKKADHEDKKKVKEGKDLAKSEELTMEWNPNEPDEPEEYDPQDYELGYASSGGRNYSKRDVRRKMSGLYSDDEIADLQQRDAVKAGRIPAPTQTPREKF